MWCYRPAIRKIGKSSAFNRAVCALDPIGLRTVERKIFWVTFALMGLVADFVLPLWWALGATIPIFFVSWWVAYRSGWF